MKTKVPAEKIIKELLGLKSEGRKLRIFKFPKTPCGEIFSKNFLLKCILFALLKIVKCLLVSLILGT
jgi:hypothetical protein